MVRARSQECDRMRSLVSAELDGELSDFEATLLRTHLDGCSAFKRDVARFTGDLRGQPLELMDHPIVVQPRRRRVALQPLRMPAVAALAVSAIALGTLFETLHSRNAVTPRLSFSQASARDLARDQQAIQRWKTETALAQARRTTSRLPAPSTPNFTPSLNPPPL